MKSRLLIEISFFISLFTFSALECAFCQTQAADLTYCLTSQLVRNFYDTSQYIIVCTECQLEYILSYNMSICTHYSQFSGNYNLNCKRLGKNGLCLEAVCGIQINEMGMHISIEEGFQNENCARYDQITGKCVYPRLNYQLNINDQILTKNIDTYCAIQQNGICTEYHAPFIKVTQEYSAFIPKFINLNQVDFNKSTYTKIICSEGYELIKSQTDTKNIELIKLKIKYHGCLLIDYKITGCLFYDQFSRRCTQCQKGLSLNSNKNECIVVPYCSKHQIIAKSPICLECESGNYLESGVCYPLKHCAVQAKNSYCALCFPPQYGQRCERLKNDISDDCELLGIYGYCAKCKNNEEYFFHPINQKCELRRFSKYCVDKSYISDQCNSLECQDGYHYNTIHFEFLLGDFQGYQQYSCDYLQNFIKYKDGQNLYSFVHGDYIPNYYWLLWDRYWWDYCWWGWHQYQIYDHYYQQYLIPNMNILLDIYYYKYQFSTQYGLRQYPELDFCIKREQSIDQCQTYDKCFESCQTCKEGFYSIQRTDIYQNYFYRYTCQLQISPTKILIEYCKQYNQNLDSCIQCEDYYSNYYDSCQIGTIQNCRLYGDKGSSVQCEQNYALFNSQCFYVELCAEYNWIEYNLFCTRCIEMPDTQISLVQSSNQLRQDCVINLPNDFCSQYIDDQCVRCQRGKITFLNQFYITFITKSLNFLSKQKILKLKNNKFKGYVFIENVNRRCIKEADELENCFQAQYVNSQISCQSCLSGFKLVNQKCQKIDGRCSQRYYCDDWQCWISCSYGYSVYIGKQICKYQCIGDTFANNYGNCIPCSWIHGQGCQKCNIFQCEECKDGYIFDQRQMRCRYQCQNGSVVDDQNYCNNCISKNCSNCITNDQCISCVDGLYLQEGQCLKDCQDGFTSTSNQSYYQTCQKIPENCVLYDFDWMNYILYCKQCKNGFYLRDSKCTDKCDAYVMGNQCIDVCDKFIIGKQCVDSCPSFYIFNHTAKQMETKVCIDSCPYYIYEDNQKGCTQKCREGYRHNEELKTCEKCQIPNCLQCYKDSKSCDSCFQSYFLVNNECQYVCPESQRVVRDQYECNKCNIFGCKNDCNYEGYCYSCEENFILSRNSCRCPEEQGYFLDYPAFCKKCQIDNCIQCSKYESCNQCGQGYNLFFESGIDINTGYWERQSCVKDCPNGFFSYKGKCKKCVDNCKECSTGLNCYSCKDGYIPVSIDIQSDGLQYKQIKCYYLCPDGSKVLNLIECPCIDKNCKKCIKDVNVCETCNEGFQLVPNYGCDFVEICPIKFCSICDTTGKRCLKCTEGYQLINGQCRYICPSGVLAQENTDICPNTDLCEVEKCQSCVKDQPRICKICKDSYYRDIFGKCVKDCNNQNSDNQKVCIPCPFVCETCDGSGNCKSCKGNNTLENKCQCPFGFKFYKNSCVKKCPFYSTQIGDTICIEHCVDGLYPFHTANKQQRFCEKVVSPNSNFCIQNIENLPELLSFKMESKNFDTVFILSIRLEQTPSVCYQLTLKGKDDADFPIQLLSDDNEQSLYQTQIPRNAIEKKLLDCTDLKCTGSLQIKFAEEIQYVVFVTFNFDISIIITNGLSFQGSYSTFNAVCPTCIIPTTLTIPSTVSIVCPENNQCSNSVITTTTNSQIQITQYISDKRFLKNKLQPHSLKLVYINSKGEDEPLFINNYFYDNSNLGQITYTFKAIALRKATLIITSVCTNAIVGDKSQRILTTDSNNANNNTLYPQFKVSFIVSDQEVSEQSNIEKKDQNVLETQNNTSIIILGSILSGVILLIIIIGFIIYRIRQKKQIYPLALQNSQQQKESQIGNRKTEGEFLNFTEIDAETPRGLCKKEFPPQYQTQNQNQLQIKASVTKQNNQKEPNQSINIDQ